MVPKVYSARVAAIVLALSVLALAESPLNEKLASIHIKNFGRINDKYFRGAQPQPRDYPALAALGVKAVVDLQQQGETREPDLVKAAGMKFYRIAMTDSSRPSRDQVETFFKIVDDPDNQPVFVHCHGGRHRTGAMTAIYRLSHDGWSLDRAFAEMQQYDFSRGFGHGALKDFVFEYYARMDRQKTTDKGLGMKVGSGSQ